MENVKIIYLGIRTWNGRDSFAYSVEVNGHSFEYFTGLGWATVAKRNPNPETHALCQWQTGERDAVLNSMSLKARNSFGYQDQVFRRKPSVADVLECLKSDAEAGSMSFIDFCDSFGYDSDSIKALDIYRACMDTAQKLRGFKFPESEESCA